jgi:UDP-2,3-diacylglucosamine hydrolase
MSKKDQSEMHTNHQNYSLFISDLHLCEARPNVTSALIRFLKNEAENAENLFILGDLFEYWAGDDDMGNPHHQSVIQALKTLSDQGTKTFFIHGNRDFLIGEQFSKAAGITLLKDPTMLELYGLRVLMSHGDDLCTDDVAYQAFRNQVRSPEWQKQFLEQSLASRKAQIEALRIRSEDEKSGKPLMIMDINPTALEKLIISNDFPTLFIHGHTHRPKVHHLSIHEHQCERIVLGDWYDQGSCLRLDQNGFQSVAVNI